MLENQMSYQNVQLYASLEPKDNNLLMEGIHAVEAPGNDASMHPHIKLAAHGTCTRTVEV